MNFYKIVRTNFYRNVYNQNEVEFIVDCNYTEISVVIRGNDKFTDRATFGTEFIPLWENNVLVGFTK